MSKGGSKPLYALVLHQKSRPRLSEREKLRPLFDGGFFLLKMTANIEFRAELREGIATLSSSLGVFVCLLVCREIVALKRTLGSQSTELPAYNTMYRVMNQDVQCALCMNNEIYFDLGN